MKVKSINRDNVTFDHCSDFVYALLNGFCEDELILRTLPGNYHFGEPFFRAYPNVGNQDLKKFKRLQRYMAHEALVMVLGGGNIMNNTYDDSGAITAASMWALPRYSPLRVHLSPLQRLTLTIKKLYWKFTDSISFWLAGESPTSIISERSIHDWGVAAFKEAGTWPTPARIEELSQLPEEKLVEEIYPVSYSYYLRFLAVTVQARRQGLGKKMLQVAEDILPSVPTTFTSKLGSSSAPAKMMLLSSPDGAALYENVGFKLKYGNLSVVPGIRLYEKVLD